MTDTNDNDNGTNTDRLDSILGLANVIGAAERADGTLVAVVSHKVPEDELDERDIVALNAPHDKTDVVDAGLGEQTAGFDPLILDPDRDWDGVDASPADVDPEGVDDHRAYRRPVAAGISEIHADSTAATSGHYPAVAHPDDGHGSAVWRDEYEDRPVRISNNHVYALSNTAELGDPIVQPSPMDQTAPRDNGRSEDTTTQSGRLVGYVPLQDDVTVDVAARSVPRDDIAEESAGSYGVDESWPTAIRRRVSDDAVESETFTKAGRTTGVTTGQLLATGASIRVNYPPRSEGGPGVVTLRNQLLFDAMSEGGDSGSPIYDADGAFVGHVFAGSPTVTVANRTEEIEDQLGVTLYSSEEAANDDMTDGATGDEGEGGTGGEGDTEPTGDALGDVSTVAPDYAQVEADPDAREVIGAADRSLSELDLEDLVMAWAVSHYGRDNVDRQVRFPDTHRVADLLIDAGLSVYTIEVENSWEDVYTGVGQTLAYASNAADLVESGVDGWADRFDDGVSFTPLVLVQSGAVEHPEVDQLRRRVPIREFELPEDHPDRQESATDTNGGA